MSTILIGEAMCQQTDGPPMATGKGVRKGQDTLFDIEGQERQVESNGQPVAINDEEEGEEGVDGRLGHDIRIEAVAQINGIDVVT